MLDDLSIVLLDREVLSLVSAGVGRTIPQVVLDLVRKVANHADTASNIAKVAQLHPDIAERIVPGIDSSLAKVRQIMNHPSFLRHTTRDQLVSGAAR